MSFCDWSSFDRRSASLEIAAERLREVPVGRGVANYAAADDAVVIVDVADSTGSHRSIEVRRGDDPGALANRYAAAIPGGISARQHEKLVNILRRTIADHFV